MASGIDVVHLGALGMPTLPDPDVIALAIAQERVVVTLDRDFTQLVAVSGARAPSIIYLRDNVDRAKAVLMVRQVLAKCGPALEAGCVVSVVSDQMRVRTLPILPPASGSESAAPANHPS
ncbi:MAG: DUF5615 family PIN-like protein [Planctomycetes bacterium]|nr:DUF5615 family PIN-like protein [Planctomycetota bacterium]